MKLVVRMFDSFGNPATKEQIKSAHPKCGECRHFGPNIPTRYNDCTHSKSPCYLATTLDPTTDYCNKWEAK